MVKEAARKLPLPSHAIPFLLIPLRARSTSRKSRFARDPFRTQPRTRHRVSCADETLRTIASVSCHFFTIKTLETSRLGVPTDAISTKPQVTAILPSAQNARMRTHSAFGTLESVFIANNDHRLQRSERKPRKACAKGPIQSLEPQNTIASHPVAKAPAADSKAGTAVACAVPQAPL